MPALKEEYCHYVLSRNPSVLNIEFPEKGLEIPKEDFLRALSEKFADETECDTLLIKAIKKNVHEIKIFNYRDDATLHAMAVKQAIKRDQIIERSNQKLPFSYEKTFELLVYYIRMLINKNLAPQGSQDEIHYQTPFIGEEDFLKCVNSEIRLKDLDYSVTELDAILGVKTNIFPIAMPEDNYLKFALMATYQYNKEIEGGL